MRKAYRLMGKGFEKLASFAIAVCLVIFWLTNKQFHTQEVQLSLET